MCHFRAKEKGGIGLCELVVQKPLEIVLQTTASELWYMGERGWEGYTLFKGMIGSRPIFARALITACALSRRFFHIRGRKAKSSSVVYPF